MWSNQQKQIKANTFFHSIQEFHFFLLNKRNNAWWYSDVFRSTIKSSSCEWVPEIMKLVKIQQSVVDLSTPHPACLSSSLSSPSSALRQQQESWLWVWRKAAAGGAGDIPNQADLRNMIGALTAVACLYLLVGVSLQVDAKNGKEAASVGNFMEDEQWLSTISQYSRKTKHWNRFRDVSAVFSPAFIAALWRLGDSKAAAWHLSLFLL